MTAVAHASPADFRQLARVRSVPTTHLPPARAHSEAVYRRRRALALVVAAGVAVALMFALHALRSTVPVVAAPAAAGVYVVQPGDTFWDIARRLQPSGDPRPLVTRLVAAHGSPLLVPGEHLVLPAAA